MLLFFDVLQGNLNSQILLNYKSKMLCKEDEVLLMSIEIFQCPLCVGRRRPPSTVFAQAPLRRERKKKKSEKFSAEKYIKRSQKPKKFTL